MKKIKIISIITLILNLLLAVGSVKAANIGETKDLERGELGYYCVQKWNGSRWIYLTYNQTFYTDTDGQKYIAYCLCPGLPGVGYVSGEKESYQVHINELLDNDIIWRVLKNGYPNKSIEELGVETADDAYFATMQAVNAILRGYSLEQVKELYTVGQFSINGESYEDIQRRGNKTLNAMFNLVDIGLNGSETRNEFLSVSIKQETELQKENEDFYSLLFSVQSSSEIAQYNVHTIENLPDGAYISDEAGVSKDVFNGSERFKIMIPANQIQNDISGKIIIKAKQKNYPIYYGASAIEGFQDYALCNNSYSEVFAESEIYIQTNKSKLKVVKVDKETQKPIQGVKFEITSTDGIKNTFITDENGEVNIANLYPGIVTIKEIQSIDKYRTNKDEIEVNLGFNEIKEIKVENEKQKGSIKIIKVDKDNNEIKLENVKFQLKDNKGKVLKEGITDINGELVFKNIVVGDYKIAEVDTNNEYKLLNEEINVKVKDGKVTELKVENKKETVPEEPEEQTPEEPQEPKIEEPTIQKVEQSKKVEVKKQETKKLPKTGESSDKFFIVEYLSIIAVYNLLMFLKYIK